MRRLITLVNHPENAAVIRAELRAIDGSYGPYGARDPHIPDVPCPYVASLLGSAWTTDLEAGRQMYISGVTLEQGLLPAWMGCWDGDTSHGISILDITEPNCPAYCFLRGWPEEKGVLNAHGYLSAYFPIDKYKASLLEGSQNEDPSEDEDSVDYDSESDMDEEDGYRYESGADSEIDEETGRRYPHVDEDLKRHLLQATHALEGVPVISADLLQEAWPEVCFQDATSSMTDVEVDIPLGPLSLADLTLDVAVKHALGAEDPNDLERLIWLPGKAGEIKKVLRDLDPFPGSGTQLLRRALSELKEGSRVDLSGYQLSRTQLVEVLSGCNEISFLDASFNRVLVADDIPKILDAAPTLRRLVIIGCSSITDARIFTLVKSEPSRFKSLEGLLHPAFLTTEKPDPYPTAFTFVNIRYNSNIACASLPFFTPAQVVQALIDIIPWRDARLNRDHDDTALPLAGFSAFHGGARTLNETFAERAVVSVPFLSPLLPRGQKDFWTFVISRYDRNLVHNRKPMWGFVHFTRSEDELSAGAALLTPTTGNEGASISTPTQRGTLARPLGCSGRLYDLRGFLECMASEGRPMPSEAAVKELERILYKKHRKSGGFYCPFMTEEDVQEVELAGCDGPSGERYDAMGFRASPGAHSISPYRHHVDP